MFRPVPKTEPLHIFSKICERAQNHVSNKCRNVDLSENHFCWESRFEQVDLICHLRPIRSVENDRTLIFFLSHVRQKYENTLTLSFL